MTSVNPLGDRFNPFDPSVQERLNRAVEDIDRLIEIEEDLQRVVREVPPPPGGVSAAPSKFFIGVTNDANPSPVIHNDVEQPNKWWYKWSKAKPTSDAYGAYGSYVYGLDLAGPNSDTPLYSQARNVLEQQNGLTLSCNGTPVGVLSDPAATVTVKPIPMGVPGLFWTEPIEIAAGVFFNRVFFLPGINGIEVACG